ncbi:MAG TPA: acyl-CoA dehydrogenase family protein [Methylomirabilota bacterium]|nr:acyl-CoA dehydrogenase family protein [Methylomirabilota bacterium]
MDFSPSPSQQLLVATARDFLRRHCPPETAQRLALDERGFDEAFWRRMAELGWPGLLVPGDFGGSDGSLLDVILLVEEMGRAALPGPFVASAVVATSLLMAAGSAEQRARLLPGLAAGERIVTLALVEDGGSFDPGAISLQCEVPGRLTGTKLFVNNAHVASDLIVGLRGGDLLLLPADRRGIAQVPLDTLSGEKTFEVTFDRVEVRTQDRLGLPGCGAEALAAALAAGALARTAEMVGAAQRVLDLAVEHAKTRVQGGRPIGAYQAIQHACADLVRDVDTSRGLVYVAAWKASEGLPAGAEVATAKAYAGEACLTVARRGHQIFGAIGYCEEHPLHLLHKRIHAASLDFGDAGLHLETVARDIGLR